MGAQVLREKLANIRDRKFFSIMADEGTYISNLEQLFFCARTVDDDLNDDKDFLGFYEIVNIKSETVARATKDILMRCSLRLDDCRGQTYDGASNMMGKHSGVSTKISEEQTKATATHCQDHSLSLAVKSLTKECPILRDTMGTVGEIYVLVKYSSKREKMLGKLTENVEGTFDRDEQQATKLDKLCVSRCTVRANCLKKIIGNCKPLLKLWKKSLEEKLDADMKSRIIGCKKQMESFKFYFGFQLDHKLYAHIDNLSKTLQQEKMSAIKGKSLADLTVQILEGIRNDRDYNLFYESVEKSAGKIKAVSKPTLPRKPKPAKFQYPLICRELHNHISRQSTTKQLIPLSIRFGTILSNLDSKCLIRLSSYS